MLKLRLLALPLLLASYFILHAASPASANEHTDRLVQTLSVSPLLIDIAGTYPPGSVLNVPKVKVTNLSKAPLTVRVNVRDFVAGGEHGEPQVVAPGDKDYVAAASLATYLFPESTDFTLEPQASRELAARITIPAGAEPGGHYGVIQFIATNTATGGPVSARGSVGTLILLRVAGTTVESGNVASLRAYVKQAGGKRKNVRLVDPMDKQPIVLETRFRNTGNVHYKPQGTVKITNLVGGSTTIRLSPETVLPRSIRAQSADWSSLPLISFAKVSASYAYGDASPKQASADPYYLVVFPWKLALGILAVVLVFWWRDRRREKRFQKMVERSKSADRAELG